MITIIIYVCYIFVYLIVKDIDDLLSLYYLF